jgi:hypothetical protein
MLSIPPNRSVVHNVASTYPTDVESTDAEDDKYDGRHNNTNYGSIWQGIALGRLSAESN